MVMRVVRHKPFLPGPVDGLRALDDDTEDHVYDTVGKHFDSRLSLEIHQEFTKVFILIHNATRFFHNSSLTLSTQFTHFVTKQNLIFGLEDRKVLKVQMRILYEPAG